MRMILVIGNGIALLCALFIMFRIMRMSSKFYWNYGDVDIQLPLRTKILQHLLALIVVAILAIVLNLTVGLLDF